MEKPGFCRGFAAIFEKVPFENRLYQKRGEIFSGHKSFKYFSNFLHDMTPEM